MNWLDFLKDLEDTFELPYNKITMTPTETNIYTAITENLGEHLTLDNNVPQDKGCAEAMSKLLSLAGIPVPKNGIAGTAAFLAWLQANPDFEEIDAPEQGAIIVSATGSGNGQIEGHTGAICAFNVMYVDDFGIASNDSNTGTLREQWSYKKWIAYYEVAGGMKAHIFRPL